MGKLEGKIALITGGNGGIGLATAKRFVKEGAHVFITGRRDGELAAAAREIGKDVTAVRGGGSHLVDLDRLAAPVASGWSDCRVGLVPTEKRRLSTAHTRSIRHP